MSARERREKGVKLAEIRCPRCFSKLAEVERAQDVSGLMVKCRRCKVVFRFDWTDGLTARAMEEGRDGSRKHAARKPKSV